ncbi:MAG: POTRA domain-containing protein [Myxococcota bacterium]|nr:POTRA domain-containing protein [Myxococcota bacterium]
MKYLWSAVCLYLLFVAFPAFGATEGGKDAIQRLDRLRNAPLPGESGPPPKRGDGSLSEMAGKIITEITAIDPPAGYDPVADANIPLGIRLDASVVRRAVIRLWESGLYSDVQIFARPGSGRGGRGVTLLIQVEPMLRVRRLEIRGNKAMKDDDVARAIEHIPDRTIRPEPEVLRKLKRKLLTAYTERGYREAQTALRLETTREPGRVVLVAEIEEGRPERYTRIRIHGLPEPLQVAKVAKAVGLKEGILRDRRAVEEKVQELSGKLAEMGYPDAQVVSLRERRLDQYEIELVIGIVPGVETEIAFLGNRHFRKPALVNILKGDGAFRTSPVGLNQGIQRVVDHCLSNGFFHTKVDATRMCVNKTGLGKIWPVAAPCPAGTVKQLLLFRLDEGPMVEVTKVLFSGNRFFDHNTLEEEVFAFIKERNGSEDILHPFSTETLDDLGVSDKRPPGMARPRGMKSVRREQSRTYVPELYLKAMDHLSEVYQEQGFLSVSIEDTCNIESLKQRSYRGEAYKPLAVRRQQNSSGSNGNGPKAPCVFTNEEQNQILVIVSVREGPQTRLSELTFEGNTAFPTLQLQQVAGLSVSEPYNEYRLRESAREIIDFYRSRGYMFAAADWEKSFSADMRRARVAFTVDEGPQVTIGRIRIEGAEITSERLIRERLTIEQGDIITPEEIEESEQRLMELGIFDSAVIQMVSPETVDAKKNLKVRVVEGDPQYLELSGGIATIEGLRGGFEYGYRNIAGWDIAARFRARANYRLFFLGTENPVIAEFERQYWGLQGENQRLEHHILLGLTQSHLPGTRGFIGWGIDATKERDNEPAFGATRYTGYFRLISTHSLGSKYRRALIAEARTGIEFTELNVWATGGNVNPTYVKFLRLPDGETTFWVTGLNLTFDFRNHPFNPTRGALLLFTGEYVRSGRGTKPKIFPTDDVSSAVDELSDEQLAAAVENGSVQRVERRSNFIRTQLTLSGYLPFGDTTAVLALSVTGGYIFHLDRKSRTWADRYFYAGGVDTLRGFPEESLVPEDLFQAWKQAVENPTEESDDFNVDELISNGGEAMLIARAEMRFPLAGGFYGAIFGEVGNLWRDQKEVDLIDFNPLTIYLRPVTGGGLRYLTGLGVFSLDLGINLYRRPFEERFAPFLSIGSAF